MESSSSSKYLVSLRQEKDIEKPLSLCRKICFAVGGAPYQMTCTVIAFFLNIYLLEVAQLPPRYVSIILFSGKAWDAITDPSIGLLVLKTNTRWGSMRPWILFSAPFACTAYFFLFYMPWPITEDRFGVQSVEASNEVKLAYYFVAFCLFEGLLSCLHVPYTALTMYVTSSQEDRDSITAYRMGFEAMGVLVAVVVQGQFVSDERCSGKDGDMTSEGNIDDQKKAYMKGAIVVIAIYIVCSLVVFFGSKENKGVVTNTDDKHNSFFSGIKLVFSFKPFVWASLTFLFMSIAIAIVQGNLALYCTHTLKIGDQFSYFILVLLVVSIISMPFWQFMIYKVGKKKTYAIGLMLLVPTCIAQLYLPEGVYWIYYVMMVLSAQGISVMLLLPWSVLPDVLDLYMLERNTRHDSLFYSFYVFFNKLAAGIALGVSQIVLDLSGYLTGDCNQPDEVGYALRLLIAPGPVVCLLLALWALHKYPIDETRRRQIKQGVMKLVVDSNEAVSESESYETMAHNSGNLGNSGNSGISVTSTSRRVGENFSHL